LKGLFFTCFLLQADVLEQPGRALGIHPGARPVGGEEMRGGGGESRSHLQHRAA